MSVSIGPGQTALTRTVRRQLDRHRARQVDHAALGRAVHRAARVAHDAGLRGDVDDVAAPLAQRRQRRLGGEERALQVDVDGLVPECLVAVLHQHFAEDAGIVDEHVEPAEGGERRLHRGPAAGDRADVAGRGDGLRAGAELVEGAPRRTRRLWPLTATRAPAARKARTAAAPMPRVPPVTSTALSRKSNFIVDMMPPCPAHHKAPVETVMSWALMPEDSSRQRKAATAPISSGSMMLLRG